MPLFKTMKTRDPRILMKCLSLFKLVPSLVKDEVILVEQYLPLLWNYSMASTLNKSQFTEFTKVVNKISADIQSIHINKLKEGSNENYEHDNSDKNKAFTKIIEAQSQPKREDRDTTLAKSIATPAIQPRRKKRHQNLQFWTKDRLLVVYQPDGRTHHIINLYLQQVSLHR